MIASFRPIACAACALLVLSACDAKPAAGTTKATRDAGASSSYGADPRNAPAATSSAVPPAAKGAPTAPTAPAAPAAPAAAGAPAGAAANDLPKDLAEALRQQAGKGLTTPLSATDYSIDPDFKVPDNLPRYAGAAGLKGTLRFTGSSTLTIVMQTWILAYAKLQTEVKIEIEGGSSAMAMPALLAGTTEVAMLSRHLTDAERAEFKAKFGYEPTEFRVGADAIAIYVNRKNPLKSLTIDQAERIFGREPLDALPIESWDELGLEGDWKGRWINVVGPRPGIGSYDVFRSLVLRGRPYRTSMDVQVVDPSIVNGVGSDTDSIGFASRFLATRRTRMVPIAPRADAPAVLPGRVACLTGTYPLARPLCFVINVPPGKTPSPLIQDFVRYCMSYEGQQDSAERGDYPVSREMSIVAYAAVGIARPTRTTENKIGAPAAPAPATKKP